MYRLSDNEVEIMGEPVCKPLTPMSNWISVVEQRFHPDLAACTDLDGTGRCVVCPQVECAAARQFEARMMPVASQDAVLDAAAFERETHVRAAIVEREDVPAFMYEEYWAMAAVHYEPPFGFQLLKAAGAYEIRRRDIHSGSSDRRSWQLHSARAFDECQIHPPIS